MASATVVIDENGWFMESGPYGVHVKSGNLDAEIYHDGVYIGVVPDAFDYFRAMKAMEREFRERYEGGGDAR